jgi:hypothetical protein
MFILKKINWYTSNKRLNQAITSGLEYALVNPDGTQITPFAFCKDYLQDAIQAKIINKKRSIYGFSYDPKVNYPISLKSTDLLISNSKDFDFETRIPNCLDFIHQAEKILKIKKTCVFKCEDPPLKYLRPNVFYLKGSNRWIKSAPMLSMYTLFIRIGLGHLPGDSLHDTMNKIISKQQAAYQPIDSFRLSKSIEGINYIFNKGDLNVFGKSIKDNYPEKIKVSMMHNKFGIANFMNKSLKKTMPQWFKEQI